VRPASAESPLHQHSTISLRGLIRFLVAMVVTAVVIHVVIWLVFVGLRARSERADVPVSGTRAGYLPPPAPQLQPSVGHDELPVTDVGQMNTRDRAEFERRGWVDRQTGEVRIPDAVARQVIAMTQQQPPATRPAQR
jgi:hypothetical protein